MGLGNVGMQKKKIITLADLPKNADIQAQLENPPTVGDAKTFSARVKLTIEWNKDLGEYILTDNDIKILADYNISRQEIEETLI